MNSGTTSRSEAIDLVAGTLIKRASLLTRLLLRHGDRELTRTEAGLLLTLLDGERRITELADTEALAQPSVTRLVDRLAERGLVAKGRSVEDGRVVLVSISDQGTELIESTRSRNQHLMREIVVDLDDRELGSLVEASASIQKLIEALQERPAGK